jgi:hypothetical protein
MLLCTSYTTDIGLPLLTIHCSALSHLNGNINWARTDEWNKKRLRTDLDYIRTIRIEVACRGGMTSAVVEKAYLGRIYNSGVARDLRAGLNSSPVKELRVVTSVEPNMCTAAVWSHQDLRMVGLGSTKIGPSFTSCGWGTTSVLSTIQSTATVSQSVSATSLPTTPDFAFDKGILAIAIVSGDITLILLLFATVSIITGIVLLKVMMRRKMRFTKEMPYVVKSDNYKVGVFGEGLTSIQTVSESVGKEDQEKHFNQENPKV